MLMLIILYIVLKVLGYFDRYLALVRFIEDEFYEYFDAKDKESTYKKRT